MKRKLISFVLAASMAVSCVCPASAAGGAITVPVNSVVELGDNVVVASNAITQSELMKKYEESKSNIASNYSDIDSNRDKVFDDLIPPVLSDDDLNNKKTSREMTFEEFYNQIYKPSVPDSDPEIEKLKKKYDKEQQDLRKKYELTDEDIAEFTKAIQNGINPLTGEPFTDPEGNPVNPSEDVKLDIPLDAMADWTKNLIDTFSKYLTKHEKDREHEFDDKYKEMMNKYLKEHNEDYLDGGRHWYIDHEECDEDEYINDTLVYDNKNQDITDIKYRCAKCGKLYGFDQFCDCDKYLDGSVFYYDASNNRKGKDVENIPDKRDNWEFEGDYSVDPDLFSNGDPWKEEYPDDSKYESGFIYHCHSCFKTLSVYNLDYKSNNLDQFYIGSTGEILCQECYNRGASGEEAYIYGNPNEGQAGLDAHIVWADDMVTDSEDPVDWGEKDHWQKYIRPCKAVYPDGNFSSMMDAYRANLSGEALEAFDENLAIFDAMSNSSKSTEENFNDYIKNLSKSKDKKDQERAEQLKGRYADFKEKYDQFQQAGGKENFIDGLIIDAALERGDYSLIDNIEVSEDLCKGDTLVTPPNAMFNNFSNIRYRCGICGQTYGFNKKCGCKNGKFLDGSMYKDLDPFPPSYFDDAEEFEALKDSMFPASGTSDDDLKSVLDQMHNIVEVFGDENFQEMPSELLPYWEYDNPYDCPWVSVCNAVSTEEGRKKRIQDYINTLPEDQRSMAESIYENLFDKERSSSGTDFGGLFGSFLKSAFGTISGPAGTDVASGIAWLLNLVKNANLKVSDDYEKWDIDDLKEMYRQMKEKQNQQAANSGLSDEEKKQKESEYSKDSQEFGDSEKQKQLADAKKAYAEYLQKLGERKQKVEDAANGLFDPDMTQEEAAQAFRDYVAGYTSVTDKVTLVTTVDYSDFQNLGQGGSYDVKGNVRAYVTDSDGDLVAEREAVAGNPMTWVAYQVGHYNVKRVVDVYHIEWDFTKCTATVNAALVLPDGTSLEVISGREITRIVENKDSLKQTNCQEYDAGSFSVNVVEGNMDPNKSDFYDTERVK